MKTAREVKEEFRSKGLTFNAWARENGFSPMAVHRVISGKTKCWYGNGHKIAVMLGMKGIENSRS